MTKRICVGLYVTVVAACGPAAPAPSNLFDHGSGARVVRPASFDTLWEYGGPDDTVFADMNVIAAAPDGALYVYDMQAHRVSRLSAHGNVDWSWGSPGEGPGELGSVRDIDALPTGGVVLADVKNCRLFVVSKEGSLVQEKRLACDYSTIEGIAALSGDRFLLATNGPQPWIIVSLHQDSVRYPEVPWSGFASMSFLQTHGVISAWGGHGGWIFGFVVGNGWMTWSHTQHNGTFPYVEHVDFPGVKSNSTNDHTAGTTITVTNVVDRPDVAAYALDTRQDTLFVLAQSHAQTRRARLVDKYGIRDGRYLYSVELPEGMFAQELAVHGDVFFVTYTRGYFTHVAALRYSAASE